MRMSGKTTRTIDKAIQCLFKHGVIHVPRKVNFESTRGRKKECVIVDPDHELGSGIQRHLFDSILKRISFEHNHKLKDIEVLKNSQTIYIKDFKL